MRILVADTLPDAQRGELIERGHQCRYEPQLSARDLAENLVGAEALVVRSTAVTAEALHAADSLRFVVRAGSGVDTIDCAAAADRGILVCNVPGRNAIAVAELAFALLLALDRHIVDNVTDLRGGRWDKARYARAGGIFGSRIGVVGLGGVGLAFAERAAAFGAVVHAVARQGRERAVLDRAGAIGMRYVDSMDALARTCDVLSFHVPATEDTRGLVGPELFAAMSPGTIVLNTSRAEILDEDALIDAMERKDVRAGIDVFRDEPGARSGEIDSRLARHPNVYGTHHIGASTAQAQQAVAAEVVRMVDAFDAGEVPHCVNLDAARPAETAIAGRAASPSGGGS